MFDNGDIDVNPLLAQWLDNANHTTLLHLKDLLLEGINQKKGHQLDNAFASEALSATIKQWINSSSEVFCRRIERFIADSDWADEDPLDELSWAYEMLKYQFSDATNTTVLSTLPKLDET